MRISDWSSDVCSSDLATVDRNNGAPAWTRRLAFVAASAAMPAALLALGLHGADMLGQPPSALLTPAPWSAATASSFMATALLAALARSEEHTSELQSLMRISYAVFCLKKKKNT